MIVTTPKWLKGMDLKTILLVIVSALFLLSLFFGPRKIIETNKDKLNQLHKENKTLQNRFDSLEKANKVILMRLSEREQLIESKDIELNNAQTQIEALKNRRPIVKAGTLSLDANSVSEELTKYLKERK